MIWDKRDLDLGLRDKLAAVIAEIISGAAGAIPDQSDYDLADSLRIRIEQEVSLW